MARIALVCQNALSLERLSKALSDVSYDVTFPFGLLGFRPSAGAEDAPDMAVVRIVLCGLAGREIVRRIRLSRPELPVVLIGSPNPATVEEAIASIVDSQLTTLRHVGLSAILYEPIDIPSFLVTVRDVLSAPERSNWLPGAADPQHFYTKSRIMGMIEDIVNAASASLSDSQIVDILDDRGVRLARRTVSKYRGELEDRSSGRTDEQEATKDANRSVLGAPATRPRYTVRPAAYAVVVNGDRKICVIDVSGKMLLPGGGIEEAESPAKALQRELMEELGIAFHGLELFGVADDFVIGDNGVTCQIMGHFFLIDSFQYIGDRTDFTHDVLWLDPEVAMQVLDRPWQVWAVERFLEISPPA